MILLIFSHTSLCWHITVRNEHVSSYKYVLMIIYYKQLRKHVKSGEWWKAGALHMTKYRWGSPIGPVELWRIVDWRRENHFSVFKKKPLAIEAKTGMFALLSAIVSVITETACGISQLDKSRPNVEQVISGNTQSNNSNWMTGLSSYLSC